MTWLRTGKEIVRHALNTWGLSRRKYYLRWASRAERFGVIYQDGIWRCGDERTPLSGAGSSFTATEVVRETLPALLRELGARTLVDVGCGGPQNRPRSDSRRPLPGFVAGGRSPLRTGIAVVGCGRASSERHRHRGSIAVRCVRQQPKGERFDE